ncbi:MAG: TonB-dependent receptor [Acidaminococcaceae bacterium]|nr:TonB-dependent receptor [Acidaminococcaceae bacterium]
MKKMTKAMLMTALILGSVQWGGTAVYAAETTLQEFTLDPMIVTAQRMEMRDLDTPAAVEVFTHEDLVETGGNNLQEALKFGTGLYYQNQGVKGISQGTMASKIVIRGVEKGTLVLVDGVPLNQSGRYNLDDIPLETIERVEVVRGGGAVLYGSEATGGVVNIITKGTRVNKVHTSWGNYGQQNHGVSAQMGKLGVSYIYNRLSDVDNISDPTTAKAAGNYYNIEKSENNSFNWRYNFNDNLYFTHTYSKNEHNYVYRYDGSKNIANKGKYYKDVIHKTENNMMQLHYDKDDLKAVLFYTNRDQETRNKQTDPKPSSDEYDPSKFVCPYSVNDDKSIGFEVSKRWNIGDNTALLGVSAQRDTLDYSDLAYNTKTHNYKDLVSEEVERNIYAVYGQYGLKLNDASNINFNARETWTSGATAGQDYSEFIPEVEFLHKINANDSFYAKVGQSFMLPTFSQTYGGGNIIGNADLEPQKGTHYEIGWKRNHNNHAWRVSVYKYEIDDSIEAALDGDVIEYSNEDIRNTGIEVTWDIDAGNGWGFNWGASYSNPEKKSWKDTNGVPYERFEWHDYYGKLQFNGGVRYHKDKFTGALNFNYLGDRTRDTESLEKMRPQLFTDLNLSYKPTDNSRFYLNVDNILDRRDITSSSASNFYTMGCNFMLGYEYSF